MSTTEKTWAYGHRVHRFTPGSRDGAEQRGFESLEAVRACAEADHAWYRRIGYYMEVAEAIAPDGTRHRFADLETPYVDP